MLADTIYTAAWDGERWAAYDTRGEVCAIADTFAEAADSIRARQRAGFIAPGPVHRRAAA